MYIIAIITIDCVRPSAILLASSAPIARQITCLYLNYLFRCSPCRASTPAFSSTLPRSPPTSRPRGPSSPTSKALTSPATTVTTTSTSSSSQSTINDIAFLLCYYIFIQLDHATKKNGVCSFRDLGNY